MNILEKVEKYIRQNALLSKEGKYLVALSGGADSVTLLLMLQDMGYHTEACHCNFHLRGEESDRDEQFCIDLCQKKGIPLHRIHFDTKTYAEVHKVSIEMAARDLRYKYFAQLKKDVEADGICVAHHQDDSVETLLINLIRGTGIKGLTGIAPKNGDILRPLLCISRKDILEYLKEKVQDYVTDSTNLEDDVVRNKIRLNIIPMLKEINPAVCQNIAATTHYVEMADKKLAGFEKKIQAVGPYDQSTTSQDDYGLIYIKKADIAADTSPEFALYTALRPYGFLGSVIEEILESFENVGKIWESASYQMVIDRQHLVLQKKDKPLFATRKFPETGTYMLPCKSTRVPLPVKGQDAPNSEQKFIIKKYAREVSFTPSKEAYHITLDADKVKFPLTLRRVANGDKFHPFGMKGCKLVSDYLTDKKRNYFIRQDQLVLVDADGLIIWLIGERTSDDCKIDEKTGSILDILITLP